MNYFILIYYIILFFPPFIYKNLFTFNLFIFLFKVTSFDSLLAIGLCTHSILLSCLEKYSSVFIYFIAVIFYYLSIVPILFK